MSFGKRIKQRREALNMGREELIARTGISYSQISRYEADLNQATGDVIIALAQALDVSTDWLLGNTDLLGIDGLSELERNALAVFRSKPPDRQPAMIELLKIAQ